MFTTVSAAFRTDVRPDNGLLKKLVSQHLNCFCHFTVFYCLHPFIFAHLFKPEPVRKCNSLHLPSVSSWLMSTGFLFLCSPPTCHGPECRARHAAVNVFVCKALLLVSLYLSSWCSLTKSSFAVQLM